MGDFRVIYQLTKEINMATDFYTIDGCEGKIQVQFEGEKAEVVLDWLKRLIAKNSKSKFIVERKK